jgi:hypothetical protein
MSQVSSLTINHRLRASWKFAVLFEILTVTALTIFIANWIFLLPIEISNK